MKRLIVNADDFGLTSGINLAVLELNRRGVLTSSTLMAKAPQTMEAIKLASSASNLGTGCHVVLVDGEPLLPAALLPTLVNQKTGRFRQSLASFLKDLLAGQIRESEIQAEAEAQIAHLQALGVQLTHLDTHKHTHMFPAVLKPLVRAALQRNITRIRNPFEPAWSVDATSGAPFFRKLQVISLGRLQTSFLRLVKAEGMATTNGAIGVLATGTLDGKTIDSLLQAMPDGTWELVTHPGYNDAQLNQAATRLTSSRQVELDALSAMRPKSIVELIHFGDLQSS